VSQVFLFGKILLCGGAFLRKVLFLFFMSSFVFAGENQLRSSSVAGLVGIGQWLGFSQKKEQIQTSWEKAVAWEEDANPQVLSLGWNFDLGYSLLATTSIPRWTSWQGGFQIDFLPHWFNEVQVQYDKMSYASYLHGGAQILSGYVWFLGHLPSGAAPGSRERAPASVYYSLQEQSKMEALERQLDAESTSFFEEDLSDEQLALQYPQIRLQYRFGFHLHQANPGALSQYQSGPEVEYSPRYDLRYRLAFSYFFYTPEDISSWFDGLGMTSRVRLPSFPSQEISLIAQQLFSFPRWQMYQSIAWGVQNRDLVEWKWSLGQQIGKEVPVLGVSFFYVREYFSQWGMGGGGSLMGFLDLSQINLTGQLVVTYRY